MDLICPECLGRVEATTPTRARCLIHGGTFEIVFVRQNPAAGREPVEGPARATPAQAMGQPDELPVQVPEDPANPLGLSRPHPRALGQCVRHPEVDAAELCTSCRQPVCVTCDFTFPGDVHLCPTCVSTPNDTVSPQRRRMVLWSYALGAWSSLAFVAMVGLSSLIPRDAQEAWGVLVSLLVLAPTIAGLALGCGGVDRRFSNPPWVWGAAVWNVIVLGVFILLAIVGTLMR